MPTIFDNKVFSQMALIAECLCRTIAENELPGLCFCGIIAGDQPYDATGVGGECDEDEVDGQAWVRLALGYPSMSTGVADTTPNNCASKGFGFDLEVGIMRGIRIEERGLELPAEEMLAATQLQIADMLTIQQALLCCNGLNGEDFIIGQYRPIGPEGGLVGGSWTVSVTLI